MNTDKIYAESIAKEYAPKEHSKIIALKKLDAKAKRPANIFAYTFGIVSALIAGTGMCLAMQVIGSSVLLIVFGILLGFVGIVGMLTAYPVYRKVFNNTKEKLAPRILELTDELSSEIK